MPETSHDPSPAPQPHLASTRKQNRSRNLRALLVTAGLAGGAVLLLVEVVLMVLPPAICPGAADAPGRGGATGDMAVTLPRCSTAPAALIERPGACRAGRFTIAAVIRVDQAGRTTATAGRRVPRPPYTIPGQDRAAGDYVRWSPLQLAEVRAEPGSDAGMVHGPSSNCGKAGWFAVTQILTTWRGDTMLTLIVASQPHAKCGAMQAAAPSTAGRHP